MDNTNKKSGRKALPKDLRKVSHTVTLSPKASKKVAAAILVDGTSYFQNASAYIEQRIMAS